MIAGIREEVEEAYAELFQKVDVLVFGEFEGPRELELKALFEVLRALEVEKVITTATGEEALIVPAWTWKSLEGDIEKMKWAVMPYLVKGKVEALVWFQSPHPKGGVPDIMLSPPPYAFDGKTFAFSGKPAWRIEGSSLRPLDWEPCLVVEVKRRAREAKPYPAKVRIMVSEEVKEVKGWKVVDLKGLRETLLDELKSCHVYHSSGSELVQTVRI